VTAAGGRVVGISTDPLEKSAELSESLGLTYPLYGDLDRTTIKAWHIHAAERDIAVPSTFVVTRAGRVVFRYVGERPSDRPSFDSVLAAVRSSR
jgi:peroxiredoxin